MIRAADGDEQPLIRRQTIVNGSDVAHDLPPLRLRFAMVIAQKKHEWPIDSCLNDAAEWSAVDIDACLASRIVVAELRSLRAAEGVAKDSHPRHVEAAGEFTVGGIHAVQLIEREGHVGGPRSQEFLRTTLEFLASDEL